MARKKSVVEAELKKLNDEYKKLDKERTTILSKGIGQVAQQRKKSVAAMEAAKKDIEQCDIATKNMKKNAETNETKMEGLMKKIEVLVKEKQSALPG